MNLKNILSEINPSLADLLPQGSIEKLARKHKKSRQWVGQIFRGNAGTDKYINPLLNDALIIIQDDIELKSKVLKELKDKIKPAQATG